MHEARSAGSNARLLYPLNLHHGSHTQNALNDEVLGYLVNNLNFLKDVLQYVLNDRTLSLSQGTTRTLKSLWTKVH